MGLKLKRKTMNKKKTKNRYKLRKHNKTGKTSKTGKTDKTDKTSKTGKTGKTDKTSKTGKTGKTDKTSKTHKIKGGFFNISKKLDSIKEYVKNRFINILLHGQTPIVQEKIRSVIENDIRFKKINIKIDLFIDRVETLIQKIVQTITTTTIKLTTSWVPGLSFIGAILTTVINWTVIYVKMLARGYDLYNLYNEMKVVIQEQGGQAVDVSSKIGNLQKQAIEKVANATVPNQLANIKNPLQNAIKK